MIRVDIDQGHWANQLQKLSRLMNKSLSEILKGEAKLFVEDCIRATPPFTPGKNWTESPKAQRKVGLDAVTADVKRLFKPAGAFRRLSGDKPFAKNVAALVRKGKVEEARKLMQEQGIKIAGFVKRATPEIHKNNRTKRGRTPKGKGRQFIVHNGREQEFDASFKKKGDKPDNQSIRSVINKAQKMVGTAKSGWVKAGMALGAKVPAWIKGKRGASGGIYAEEGKGMKYTVTVGNPVPYVQGTAKELRIMKWAFKNRLRNLEKRIAMVMKKQKVAK